MKVLLIRFSSIGDIVLTTPVIRCLKQQVPGVSVHFLTKKTFSSIVKSNPYVDKVWEFENDLSEVIAELKKEKFNFISDLHHNARSFRVRKSLGVKSAAFNKLNIEKWILVNFKINMLPDIHIVQRYMKTVESLGVKYDGKGLDFFIDPIDEVRMESLQAPWQKGYAAFVIGAKHATKRLPVEMIIQIINELDIPVILLGGREDAGTSKIICAAAKNAFNGCGHFRLGQSASLVKQAKFVITHDTGLMHIAAAFNQRIISVWGNTIPGFGMNPFLQSGKGDSRMMEVNHLSCRPCSKIGFEKCPRGHFKCMMGQDVQGIVKQGIGWWE